MKARVGTLILLLLPLLTGAAIETRAETLTVTKTADTADGSCDIDCSLREALIAAAPGDTITFAALFSNTPQVISLAKGQIFITRDISLQGPGSAYLNVSGANLSRIFNISNGANVAISGVTISDGRQENANGHLGGGILLEASMLELTDVVLRNNLARTDPPANLGDGGAIYSRNSSLTITNCHIYNNIATDGGIVRSVLGGTVHVVGSSFHNNFGQGVSVIDNAHIVVTSSAFTANSGGGIGAGGTLSVTDSLVDGNGNAGIVGTDALTVERCVIRNNRNITGVGRFGGGVFANGNTLIRSSAIYGNEASGGGGGIANTGLTYIENSSITGNAASQTGGGIHNQSLALYLTNSTVSDNRALTGGGIYHQRFEPLTLEIFLTNSTISNNVATAGKGGGIFLENSTRTTVKNSLIANNTSSQNEPDASGTVASIGFNLVGDTTGSTGWTTTDLLGVDPQLAALGSNGGITFTHALLQGSPATNAGNNSLAVNPRTGMALEYDQRGTPRFLGIPKSTIDIGAYEANYASASVSLVGRVLAASGRPLRNARVVLTGDFIETRFAVTNHSGYYRFLGLPVGQTYCLTATDKFYSFTAPLVVTTDQNRDDLLMFGDL